MRKAGGLYRRGDALAEEPLCSITKPQVIQWLPGFVAARFALRTSTNDERRSRVSKHLNQRRWLRNGAAVFHETLNQRWASRSLRSQSRAPQPAPRAGARGPDKRLGVDLVDVFGPRRPGSEPARSVVTLRPPIGSLLPGASISLSVIGSPASSVAVMSRGQVGQLGLLLFLWREHRFGRRRMRRTYRQVPEWICGESYR